MKGGIAALSRSPWTLRERLSRASHSGSGTGRAVGYVWSPGYTLR